jgi:hypothetical protein
MKLIKLVHFVLEMKKENGKTIKEMDMEFVIMWMENDTLGIGRIIGEKGKERVYIQMVIVMWACGTFSFNFVQFTFI